MARQRTKELRVLGPSQTSLDILLEKEFGHATTPGRDPSRTMSAPDKYGSQFRACNTLRRSFTDSDMNHGGAVDLISDMKMQVEKEASDETRDPSSDSSLDFYATVPGVPQTID